MSSGEFDETGSEIGLPNFKSQALNTFTTPESFSKGSESGEFIKGEQGRVFFRIEEIRFPSMGGNISSTGLNAFLFFLILFTFHLLILGSLKFLSELFPSKESRLSRPKKDRKFCEPYEEINESLVIQRNSATGEVEVWPLLFSLDFLPVHAAVIYKIF